MRRACLASLACCLVAGSCGDHVDAWIAPFDGQTGVALDAALVAVGAAVQIPPDWPIPDPIRVVDLSDGGLVEGVVGRNGDDLVFTPSAGWPPAHRFAWTVDLPSGAPHAPEIPDAGLVEGTAVFDTSDAVDVVGAAIEGEAFCLGLSRPASTASLEQLSLRINEVAVSIAPLEVVDARTLIASERAEDDALGAACGTLDVEVGIGAEVRVVDADDQVVRVRVDADFTTLVARLRREVVQ